MTTIESRIAETTATEAPVTTPSTHTTLSREQILEATFHCLIEDGYDATTIRRIAKRLDCAIGSIYRYFTDKRELLYAVTQEMLVPVATMVELNAPFTQTVRQYGKVATNDPEAYRLMFWLAAPRQGRTAALPDVVQRIVDGWSKQLGDARRASQCWGLLHGAIIGGASAEEAAQWLAERLHVATVPLASEPPAGADLALAEPIDAAAPQTAASWEQDPPPALALAPDPGPVTAPQSTDDVTLL